MLQSQRRTQSKSFHSPGHCTANCGAIHGIKILSPDALWTNIYSWHSIIARFSVQRRTRKEQVDLPVSNVDTIEKKKFRFHGSNGRHVK